MYQNKRVVFFSSEFKLKNLCCGFALFSLVILSLSDVAFARTSRAKAKPTSFNNVCATVITSTPFLYKAAISHHISPGDKRASGPTLICGKACPKKFPVNLYSSNGTLLARLGYYARWEGNGKARAYCAAGGTAPCSNSAIARNARSKGNGKGYIQFSSASTGPSTVCYQINNLLGRNGSAF